MKNKIALVSTFMATSSFSIAEIVINDFLSVEGFVDMAYTHSDVEVDNNSNPTTVLVWIRLRSIGFSALTQYLQRLNLHILARMRMEALWIVGMIRKWNKPTWIMLSVTMHVECRSFRVDA